MSNTNNGSGFLQIPAILLLFTCSFVISNSLYTNTNNRKLRNTRSASLASDQGKDTSFEAQHGLGNFFQEENPSIGEIDQSYDRKKRDHNIDTKLANSVGRQGDENGEHRSSALDEDDGKYVLREKRDIFSALSPIKEVNNIRKFGMTRTNEAEKKIKGISKNINSEPLFFRRQGDQFIPVTDQPIEISDCASSKSKKKFRKKNRSNKKNLNLKSSTDIKPKKTTDKQKLKRRNENRAPESINRLPRKNIKNYKTKSALQKHGMQINMFFRNVIQKRSRKKANRKSTESKAVDGIKITKEREEKNETTSDTPLYINKEQSLDTTSTVLQLDSQKEDLFVVGENNNKTVELKVNGESEIHENEGKKADETNVGQDPTVSSNIDNIKLLDINTSKINVNNLRNPISEGSNNNENNVSFVTLRPNNMVTENADGKVEWKENFAKVEDVDTKKDYKFTTISLEYDRSAAEKCTSFEKSVDSFIPVSPSSNEKNERNSGMASDQGLEQERVVEEPRFTYFVPEKSALFSTTPLSEERDKSFQSSGLRIPQPGEGVRNPNLPDNAQTVNHGSSVTLAPFHLKNFEAVNVNISEKEQENYVNAQENVSNTVEGPYTPFPSKGKPPTESVNFIDLKKEENTENSKIDSPNFQSVTEGYFKSLQTQRVETFHEEYVNTSSKDDSQRNVMADQIKPSESDLIKEQVTTQRFQVDHMNSHVQSVVTEKLSEKLVPEGPENVEFENAKELQPNELAKNSSEQDGNAKKVEVILSENSKVQERNLDTPLKPSKEVSAPTKTRKLRNQYLALRSGLDDIHEGDDESTVLSKQKNYHAKNSSSLENEDSKMVTPISEHEEEILEESVLETKIDHVVNSSESSNGNVSLRKTPNTQEGLDQEEIGPTSSLNKENVSNQPQNFHTLVVEKEAVPYTMIQLASAVEHVSTTQSSDTQQQTQRNTNFPEVVNESHKSRFNSLLVASDLENPDVKNISGYHPSRTEINLATTNEPEDHIASKKELTIKPNLNSDVNMSSNRKTNAHQETHNDGGTLVTPIFNEKIRESEPSNSVTSKDKNDVANSNKSNGLEALEEPVNDPDNKSERSSGSEMPDVLSLGAESIPESPSAFERNLAIKKETPEYISSSNMGTVRPDLNSDANISTETMTKTPKDTLNHGEILGISNFNEEISENESRSSVPSNEKNDGANANKPIMLEGLEEQVNAPDNKRDVTVMSSVRDDENLGAGNIPDSPSVFERNVGIKNELKGHVSLNNIATLSPDLDTDKRISTDRTKNTNQDTFKGEEILSISKVNEEISENEPPSSVTSKDKNAMVSTKKTDGFEGLGEPVNDPDKKSSLSSVPDEENLGAGNIADSPSPFERNSATKNDPKNNVFSNNNEVVLPDLNFNVGLSTERIANSQRDILNHDENLGIANFKEENIENEPPNPVTSNVMNNAERTNIIHPSGVLEGVTTTLPDGGAQKPQKNLDLSGASSELKRESAISLRFLASDFDNGETGLPAKSVFGLERNSHITNDPAGNAFTPNEVPSRSNMNSDTNRNMNVSEESEEDADKVALRSGEDNSEFD